MASELQEFLDRYEAELTRERFFETADFFALPLSINYSGHVMIINNKTALKNVMTEAYDRMISTGYQYTKIESVKLLESQEQAFKINIIYNRLGSADRLIERAYNQLTIISTEEGLKIDSVLGGKMTKPEQEAMG